MKKLNIMILILFGFLLTACQKENPIIVKQKEIVYEYGQTISLKIEDLVNQEKMDQEDISQIQLDSSQIQNEKDKDYPAIGEYEITLSYEEEKETIKIKVEDTTQPTFKKSQKSMETYQDVPITEKQVKEVFEGEDLSPVQLSFDDSNVDYTKVGEYKASVQLSDSSSNQVSQEVVVKVMKPTIKIQQNKLSLYVKETKVLKPTVKGKEKMVTYASSSPKIATVDKNGKITAKSAGTTTIKMSANGTETTCQITVKDVPKGSTTQKDQGGNIVVVKPKPGGNQSTNSSSGSFDLTRAKEAFALQNQKRKAAGVPELKWNDSLYNDGKVRAKEIDSKFSHTRPDGSSCFTAFTGNYMTMGENIAKGYQSASSVVTGWYNSPGHKQNMLSGDFTSGAIIKYGDNWVALFAG